MSSKILNKYSLILFNLDRNTYNAYRKMMETSRRKYKIIIITVYLLNLHIQMY